MADIMVENLEPNSHKYRAEKEKEKYKPVVKKESVVSTKKSMFQKFADDFVNRDMKSVKAWLIQDVLIPGAKETALNLVGMILFNEPIRGFGPTSYDRDYNRNNYRSYYGGNSNYSRIYNRDYCRNQNDYGSDDKIDYRNIVLRRRDEAERVVDTMIQIIQDTGEVSVANLLDLVDLPTRFTDNSWGWTDPRSIGIRRVAGGFLIDVDNARQLP